MRKARRSVVLLTALTANLLAHAAALLG